MKKEQKKDIFSYGIMLLIGFAFYFLPGKWISIEDDTIAYLDPKGREGVLPGYPAFLAFFKDIFGEQYFLDVVVVVQSILAVICTLLFILVLKEKFKLKRIERIFLYVLCMLPFSIYLPEAGITHQIMTEGITYAIFYIFFITVIKAIWSLEYRWYFGSLCIAVLLGLIRSQMLFLQIICMLILVYISVKRYGKKRVLGIGICIVGLLVGGMIAIWPQIRNMTSQFDSVLVARGFYEADEKDENLYNDDMMKEIFRKTYQLADKDKHRYVYAEPGLYMWQDLVYDRMKNYVSQAIAEYDSEHPGERIVEEKEIYLELGIKELFAHFGRYLYHTVRLMIPSFIASVFFQIKPIYLLCHFIALFLYVMAVWSGIYIYKKGGNYDITKLMITVISIMVIMVVMVNILFIGLQRYVVYGMGIFYCSCYLSMKEIYLMIKKEAVCN